MKMNKTKMPKPGETIKLTKMIFTDIVDETGMSICKTWILGDHIQVVVKDILYKNIIIDDNDNHYRINIFAYGDDFYAISSNDV